MAVRIKGAPHYVFSHIVIADIGYGAVVPILDLSDHRVPLIVHSI